MNWSGDCDCFVCRKAREEFARQFEKDVAAFYAEVDSSATYWTGVVNAQ